MLAPARPVVRYLILTYGISTAIYGLMLVSEIVRGLGFVLLMWTPAAVAFGSRGIGPEARRALGFRRCRARYVVLGLGLVLPLAWSVPVYALIWLLGLGDLDVTALAGTARRALGPEVTSRAAGMALVLLLHGTVGILFAGVLALGEEMGWRGFLVAQLAERASFARTAVLSGVVWAVWHYPAILLFGYRGRAPLWYGLLWVTVGIVAGRFVLAWLRLRSGSVWPATLMRRRPRAGSWIRRGSERDLGSGSARDPRPSCSYA